MTYLKDALAQRVGEFVRLRRDMHQHPELGFAEHRTSALVAAKLEEWGYEVDRGLGGTGVVGQLVRGRGSKRLGLRADMDALALQEASDLPWASTQPGVMHGCGHDGHTAMLLSAARHLAEDGRFDGTLNLIFQPAEEGLAGARRMMEDGLFDRFPCDAIFAMHNMPGIPTGKLVVREGAMLTSSDFATIVLTGKGGHGAMPHQTRDPIVAAASLVMALQTLVSRNTDPLSTAVVTVGVFQAGTASNVIPSQASMEVCIRTLDPEIRLLMKERLYALVHAQAQSFGMQAEIAWRSGYPAVQNSPAETAFARAVAVAAVGAWNVTTAGLPITASEDFAFMLEAVPGCYLLIGNGDGESACAVHNPQYDFNDDNIAVGTAFWVRLVEDYLAVA